MSEGYYIEEIEPGLFQSVFPSEQADYSQLHTTIADAVAYIREFAGANAVISVIVKARQG